MENIIFNRQILKSSISKRVNQNVKIENVFTFEELKSLYSTSYGDKNEALEKVKVEDESLCRILRKHPNAIISCRLQDDLLRDKKG